MEDKKTQFIELAIIKQLKYAEIEDILKVKRKTLSRWWVELKEEREYLSSLRKIWRVKFEKDITSDISFKTFKNWYEETEKKCHYCEITEKKLDLLWKAFPSLTKRNRGRKLEIDRKKPNESYSKTSNLVFSCYWCNNAKTDTFSEAEFLKIGQLIKEIWESRLNFQNEKPLK